MEGVAGEGGQSLEMRSEVKQVRKRIMRRGLPDDFPDRDAGTQCVRHDGQCDKQFAGNYRHNGGNRENRDVFQAGTKFPFLNDPSGDDGQENPDGRFDEDDCPRQRARQDFAEPRPS